MPHKKRGWGDQSPLILLVDLPPRSVLVGFYLSPPTFRSPFPSLLGISLSPRYLPSVCISRLYLHLQPFYTIWSIGPICSPVLRDLLQNPTTPCSPPTDWGLGGVGECGIYSVLPLLQVELLATLYKYVRTYSVNIFQKIT